MKDRRLIWRMAFAGCAVGLAVWTHPVEAEDLWLISPEEAAYAPAPEESLIRSRGLNSKGPRIDVLKPADDAPQQSPLEILVQFHPNPVAINPDSVKVQLVKFISIDITDRVKPYLSESGLNVKEANIPSGKHLVRITVSDGKGETNSKEIELQVR
ncbi:MAG: hypothetical protein OEY28_11705 [Nitrospira sp.]|nr:hypothetical protein [Nitrospira sp.]